MQHRVILKTIWFIVALVSMAFCQFREHWYAVRSDITAGQSTEVGGGAGIFWGLNEMDEPPCDAYGVMVEFVALLDHNGNIPGGRLNLEGNSGIFCARIQYGIYKPSNVSVVYVINPQVGLTWLSIANLYAGYNQPLFNRRMTGLVGINISLIMNIPSYVFD